MSAVVNPRDLLLRGTPTRLVPITLPSNISIPGLTDILPNADQPPAPTGFEAVGAVYDINFRTNPPAFLQGHGYGHTKIYGKLYTGGALPVFADAQVVVTFIGQVGALTAGPALTARFWATWVTKDGVESLPAGGLNGVTGSTGEDADRLVAALTGPGKPFTVVNEATTLADGTVVPPGTYTSNAFMQRFVAGRGQIGLLAVDDARIASASATKLTTGSVQVGVHIGSSNYISGQQGWAINGNGAAEFSSVVARGTIFAVAGQIGGCTITSGGVYSPNFSETSGWGFDVNGNAQFNQIRLRGQIMGGAYVDYNWPANGQGGFYLGPQGLLLGNANVGRYFQVTSDGTIYAPGFSVVNGVLTINQANVIGTLQIRGNAVTTMVSASGGASASAAMYIPPGETLRIAMTASCTNAGGVSLYIDGVLVAQVAAGQRSAYFDVGPNGEYHYWMDPAIGMGTANVYGGAGGRNINCTVVAPSVFLMPTGDTVPACTFYALGTLR